MAAKTLLILVALAMRSGVLFPGMVPSYASFLMRDFVVVQDLHEHSFVAAVADNEVLQ